MLSAKQIIFCWLLSFSSLVCGYESVYPVDNDTGDFFISDDGGVAHEIALHIQSSDHLQWAGGLNWENLQHFYAKRHYHPVWIGASVEKSSRTIVFRDAILNAYAEGLDPAEYHASALRYLWNAQRDRSKARLELLLTDAFFRYCSEVSKGYAYPKAVDFDWKMPNRKIDLLKLLENYLVTDSPEQFLAELPPQHDQYQKLKQVLVRYRQIAKNGGWDKLGRGKVIKLGDHDPRVVQLRKRLQIEGFLPQVTVENTNNEVFDQEVEMALKQFQALNGELVDGVVGGVTRRNLNVTVEERIAEIKKNMERWRWMPKKMGVRYVMVNMAGYELNMVNNNQMVLQMPVVIGKTIRATPTFVDTLEYLEFNPSWQVPTRIAKEKFLPMLQHEPSFVGSNHLKVYDGWGKSAKEIDPDTIDWSNYRDDRDFPFKLVQGPGDHNSLGRIKFMFPNPFQIYLHDTPEKELFDKNVRTFSAGCIRVADPYLLAEKILEQEGQWDRGKIQQIVNQGETQKFSLNTKWLVYLLYWTSWVDDQGLVNFRSDVYRRNDLITTGSEPDYQRFSLL